MQRVWQRQTSKIQACACWLDKARATVQICILKFDEFWRSAWPRHDGKMPMPLPGCAAPLYVSLQQSLGTPGNHAHDRGILLSLLKKIASWLELNCLGFLWTLLPLHGAAAGQTCPCPDQGPSRAPLHLTRCLRTLRARLQSS